MNRTLIVWAFLVAAATQIHLDASPQHRDDDLIADHLARRIAVRRLDDRGQRACGRGDGDLTGMDARRRAGMAMLTPMRSVVTFDPAALLRQVACAVVLAFGGRDVQVCEAVHRSWLGAALKNAGRLQVSVRVYLEVNHPFVAAITGQAARYAKLPKALVASLLAGTAGWIAGMQ